MNAILPRISSANRGNN